MENCVRKQVGLEKIRARLCAKTSKRKSKSKIEKNFNSELKVQIERSKYIEELVQAFISSQRSCSNINGKEEILSNPELATIVDKDEFLGQYTETESKDVKAEMDVENREKLSAIPAHLPSIQITVTASGVKTTRLVAPAKKNVVTRSWKRKSADWMNDLVWITSNTNIFCNAILGKEDLTVPNSCDVVSTPKKIRPSLRREASENHDLSTTDIKRHLEMGEKHDSSKTDIKSCNANRITLNKESAPEMCFNTKVSPCKSEAAISTGSSFRVVQKGFKSSSGQSIVLKLFSARVAEQTEDKIPKQNTDSTSKESISQKHESKYSPIHFNRSGSPEYAKDRDSGNRKPQRPTPVQTSPPKVLPRSPPGMSKEFKVPFLPKRPPSRVQQAQGFNNKVTDLRAKLQMKNRWQYQEYHPVIDNDEDDAISLYAESITLEPHKPEERLVDPPRQTPIVIESTSKSPTYNQQTHQTANVAQEVVHNTKMVIDILKDDCRPDIPTIISKNPKVNDWITNTEKYATTSFDTEKFVVGSCYTFLNQGVCYKRGCRFKHELPVLPNNFNDLSGVEFQKVLKRCVAFRYAFKNWFDLILNYMNEHGRHDLILHLVYDVMKMSNDKMPFIKKIIYTLKNMGFTFDQAINEILFTTGRQNETLLDILLSFAVEEEDCVKTSWHIIANLINFRHQGLDFGVVQDIFQKCINCEPPDKNFCENIYKDIIVKNIFDLNKIDQTILLKYISLLVRFQFDSYATYIMVNYNIKKDQISELNRPQKCFSPASSSGPKSSVASPEHPPSLTSETFECLDNLEFDIQSVIQMENSNKNSTVLSITEETVDKEELGESEYPAFNTGYLPTYNSNYSKLEVANYLDNVRSDDSGNLSQQHSTFSSNSYGGYYTDQPTPYTPRNRKNSSSSSTAQESVSNITSETMKLYEIPDSDIILLLESLRNHNWTVLLTIIKRYSESDEMVRNLVVQMLAAMKCLTIPNLCQVVSKIYQLFGDYCQSDYQIINVLRLFGFNLMPILDREKQYKTASDVLHVFVKDYHSFVKYDHVGRCYERITTKDLKYVFLFKILFRCGRYKEALRLLKHPESKLVNSFLGSAESDDDMKEYKQRILSEFVKINLECNLLDAKDLIIYLLLNSNIEQWPELKMYVNILICSMLKSYSTYKSDIISMLDNVLNCWYKYLRPSVLRAFLINLYNDIPEKKILELFLLCIDIGVYEAHEGINNSISIPSDLLQEEIFLVVHYHLLKICGSQFPISSIVIKVENPMKPDEYSGRHNVLISSVAASSADMIRRILNVLTKIKDFPKIETLDISNQYIVLPYNDPFLQPYEKAAKEGRILPLLKFR